MTSIYFPRNCGDCTQFTNGDCGLIPGGKDPKQNCANPWLAEQWSVESRTAGRKMQIQSQLGETAKNVISIFGNN